MNSQLLLSLIYVGLIEENQTNSLKALNFTEVCDQKEKLFARSPNNKNLIASFQTVTQFIQTLHKFNPNLETKKHLQFKSNLFNYRKSSNLSKSRCDELINESFSEQSDHLNKALVSLNCVVSFDAILNPKAPSSKLAHQLYDIATINHFKFSLICCELIKCSLINFADSLDHDKDQVSLVETRFLNQFQRKLFNGKQTKENVRWASFVYFKVPLVLKSLKELLIEKNQSLELERGLEKLINFTPLIELIDHKTDCDCLANLLNKLLKIELVDEQFQQSLLKKKEEKIDYFNSLNGKLKRDVFKKQNENLVMIQGHILLNKAEPTVESILISLDPEIAAKPENLIQVFVKVITSNSIEIVLNTLTYTGNLHLLIKKIIYFNELNTHASIGENSKQAALRANLFDTSFLILSYIVQEHGQEIILNCLEEEGVDLNSSRNIDDMEIDEKITDQPQNSLANSFFVKFCLDYLPENLSKVNYEEKMAKNIDSNKVDGLLGLFSSNNFDYQLIKWNEVLLNVIGVFKELLQAYLNNYLTFEELSVYLLNMIKRNCSIGVVIAIYTVTYMNTVGSEEKRKIFLILNYLTNSNNFSSCFSNQNEAFTYYKEKHALALKLICNLIDDQIPKTILEQQQLKSQEKSKESELNSLNNEINRQGELYKVLKSVFLSTIRKGWLNTSSIHCFNRILCIGGATWFMDKLINLLLYECEIENLFEGVELVYGLCSLDMEQCCLALLNVVIPQYLTSYNDQSVLIEPKLTALCKLVSSVIFSVLELNSSKESIKTIKSSVRRHSSCYVEDNFIQYEDKLINDHIDRNPNDEHCTPVQFMNKSAKPKLDERKELLFNSIGKLLRLASSLLSRQQISQRTTFSLILLEQLVYLFPCAEANGNQAITNDIHKLISLGLNNKVQIILQHLPFDTVINLVRIFPNQINYDLLLSISNLQSIASRKLTARSLCQLSRSQKFL